MQFFESQCSLVKLGVFVYVVRKNCELVSDVWIVKLCC